MTDPQPDRDGAAGGPRPDLPPPDGVPVVPAGGGPELPPPAGAPVVPADCVPAGQPPDEGWQRLSRRMLLVHPVRTLWGMAFPLVVAIFAGTRGGGESPWWIWVAIVGGFIALVAGVFTWFVTRYRITDEQLQLRTGLLSRRVLTAPLDRVRSVDIESTPVHRVLGLATVKVGTGVDTSRVELDGLTREQAASLRTFLLRRSQEVDIAAVDPGPAAHPDPTAHPGGQARPGGAAAYPGVPTRPETELARIDWSWLRYAPFSLSSLVVVAGAFGLLAQFGDDLPIDQVEVAQDAWAWIVARAVAVLVTMVVLVISVGWVVLSTLSYVVSWWNLRVVREGNGNLRITRGLLTTHSQTIEREKVRGVSMGEPFLLRFVKGGELSAMATGLGLGGVTKVLPPSPRDVVTRIGHELLEEDGPLTMPLTGHGPRARRRIHLRSQWGTLFVAVPVAVMTYALDRFWWFDRIPGWLPVAVLLGLGLLNALLAESAWRNLGHGLTERHLVVQTGAVIRTREALERAGIIGWTFHQTFFQRRRGLADLHATTAAGGEVVVAPDIPVDLAADLANRATPGMLEDLLA